MLRSALAALAVITLASPVFAGPAQDDAINKSGSSVVSSYGECVRTKWTADKDPCAPDMPPPPPPRVQAPAPAPVPKIALEQRTIYFDFNKAALSKESTQKLDALVGIIQSSKGIQRATVLGYADEIGSKDYNLALSQKRADAVQQYLASRVSIPTNVLMVGGKGATDSVTSCPKTLKRKERINCLAKDRRVEIEFNYVQ